MLDLVGQGLAPCRFVFYWMMVKKSSQGAYPKRKLIRLSADAYHRTGAWYFVTVCCKEKKPLFRSERARSLVRDIMLQFAERYRVELVAYTILPNHLHLICSAGTKGLSGFVGGFKSRVSVEFKQKYGKPSPWQARFFDHKIRGDESLNQKCEYVWMNPVRRGLVKKAEEYLWSGVRLTG